MSRADRWKSDSQANADALDRRERTYSEASGASFRVSWDWHNREPRDLREAVRMVRAAYADEVPTKLHSSDEKRLGESGTPEMLPAAQSYIFGSPFAGEADRKCSCKDIADAAVLLGKPAVKDEGDDHYPTCHANPKTWPRFDFYRTPFRAALAHLERSSPPKARIVQHVSLGSLNPAEAAMRVGVPFWCAKLVAEDVLRAFLRNLTDIKVHLPKEDAAA